MKQVLSIILTLFLISCDEMLLGNEDSIISLEENLQSPLAMDDGWDVSTLAAQNIKQEPIHNLIQHIQARPNNIHSLLIIRNSKLVSESYFDGWRQSALHPLRSASKSFNATLIGIALDQEKLKDVNEKVFDFFPEYEDFNDDKKKDITIGHLLTMTAGFRWDQITTDESKNDEEGMNKSGNWIEYTLKKDVTSTPGQTFLYNSGCSNLLAGIIKKSTGDHANIFAEKYLFAPLQIVDYTWQKQKDGYCNAGYGLYLRPRDMAKLGQLYLDRGRWKGEKVVSETWITRATTRVSGNEQRGDGYGYQWWTSLQTINNTEVKMYYAAGNGGQYVYIIPSLSLVVAFTGGNFSPLNQSAPWGMLRNIIIPAAM